MLLSVLICNEVCPVFMYVRSDLCYCPVFM